MLARALESAEKEANHSQMVNMVMEENKTETLEKRVTQLGEELSKKIESYLIPDPRKNTYQPPQRCSQEVSDNRNNRLSCQEFRTETRACHFCKRVGHLISQCRMQMMQEACENNYYAPPQMPRNQYTPIPRQYSTMYQNQGAYQQQPMIANPNWQNLIIGNNNSRNINRTKNSSKLSQTIPPAVATEDNSLAAIFPFELEENEAMFSGATLDEKRPITAMYTEATVNNTPIKLILDSRSAGSIITLQLVNQLGFKVDRAAMSQIITADGSTKLPYGEIDSFPFEINGIPKFRTGFENREEESESESEKETSEKTITRPVTGTSSQSRNQETRDQEEEPDIREATFRNAQGNIIPPLLRPINPPAENGNEMTTPYIARLTDFSGEEEETDVHTWLREAQKAIQANNWNDQRAIQTLPFFLKGTADSCRSAGSIITLQLVNQLGFKVDRAAMSQIITADGSTKLPYGEIDSFPFEINGIVIPTKVLVMDATQYQVLVRNDWLTKANATLD
ncbi:hypothetical protein G9A89_008398 [Geosiphon pyriformis]|nr:hypothetical protein G9A89_008398 [Geosiphon pyriformis]